MRIKKDWSLLVQSALLPLAFVVGVGSFVLVANGKQQKSAKVPEAPPPPPPSILMVGDSLSVGKFGEAIQNHLEKKYPVAAYASCGSSPEHWLRNEPDFYTKCGYRQHTAKSDMLVDFVNGRAPRRVLTPKLEFLVEKHKPTIVIVQLGTNWMDRALTDEQMESYLDRFIKAAKRGVAKKVVWITPPDSYRLSKVQGRVQGLIRRASKRDHFEIIDSREVTHYKMGKTGGDGIHYNNESSQAWAEGIQKDLDLKIAPSVPTRQLSKFKPDNSPGDGQ